MAAKLYKRSADIRDSDSLVAGKWIIKFPKHKRAKSPWCGRKKRSWKEAARQHRDTCPWHQLQLMNSFQRRECKSPGRQSLPRGVIEDHLQMDTCRLCDSCSTVSHIHRQLIWPGSISVGVQDIGLELSRRDLAQTIYDEMVAGW